MIFTILNASEQLVGEWYYLEFTLTNKLDVNEKYFFPLIACMRDKTGALSLQSQIQEDLKNLFFVSTPEIKKLSVSEKDLQIQKSESELKNYQQRDISITLCKAAKRNVLNQATKLYTSDDLKMSNLDSSITYDDEKNFPFKIGIIKNQGVPLHQINQFPLIRIDKGKIDPHFALPVLPKPSGGNTDRMIDLNDKLDGKKES